MTEDRVGPIDEQVRLIADRLHTNGKERWAADLREAADEIERLRGALKRERHLRESFAVRIEELEQFLRAKAGY